MEGVLSGGSGREVREAGQERGRSPVRVRVQPEPSFRRAHREWWIVNSSKEEALRQGAAVDASLSVSH